MLQLYKYLTKINSEFRSFFFNRELSSLQNKTTKGVLLLAIVFGLSLIAISFSVGGMNFLNERMDNPLTNWLNVVVNSNNYKQLDELKDYFKADSVKQRFNLRFVEDYKSFPIYFMQVGGGEYRGWGRSISSNRNKTLLDAILQSKNCEQQILPRGADFDQHYAETGGLVLTKSFLEELGYDAPMQVRRIPVYLEAANKKIWVKVLAIVKEIPGRAGMKLHFICSPKFYNFYDKPGTLPDRSVHLQFISSESQDQITDLLYQYDATLALKIEQRPYEVTNDETHYQYLVRAKKGRLEQDTISNFLEKKLPFFSRFYEWTSENKPDRLVGGDTTPDNVSFVFQDWREIRSFKSFMQQRFDDFPISLLQVEEKENFNLVSGLTSGLAFFLFGFSLLSTGIFIYNLLYSHLKDNSSNLGTLKAFGLDNLLLRQTYLKIVGWFLLKALVPAIILTLLIGFTFQLLIDDYQVFSFFNPYVFLAIAMIVGFSMLITQWTIKTILRHSPGDLIYQRFSEK